MNLVLKDMKFILKDIQSPLKDMNFVLKDIQPPLKDMNFILKDIQAPLKDMNLVLKDRKLVTFLHNIGIYCDTLPLTSRA